MILESSSKNAKPNIVVIGGGYAGIHASQALESSLHRTHQIILIERKLHFWHIVGAPRLMTEENFENKLLIPYRNTFKQGGKVIHGTVTAIRKNEVIVSTEAEFVTRVPFQYLIIATGSHYPKPSNIDSMTKGNDFSPIREQRRAVNNAKKVLVIGGGSVGIELAGEIASTYKNKEVILVHSRNHLLAPHLPQKLKDALKSQLEALNVKIIFGEKVVIPEEGLGLGTTPRVLTTNAGRKIESDVQLYAIGAKPNTDFIATLDKNLLEEDTRFVKVTPYLQLDNPMYKHIFAVGDIANTKETKLAYKAVTQAALAVKNIKAMINRTRMSEYKPSRELMFVTIGKTGGAGLIPMFGGMVVGPNIVKNIKGKNLFIDRSWKQVTDEADTPSFIVEYCTNLVQVCVTM